MPSKWTTTLRSHLMSAMCSTWKNYSNRRPIIKVSVHRTLRAKKKHARPRKPPKLLKLLVRPRRQQPINHEGHEEHKVVELNSMLVIESFDVKILNGKNKVKSNIKRSHPQRPQQDE